MKDTKKKIFIVIAILVVVGIVGITGYLLLSNQQEENKETSTNEKKNPENVSEHPHRPIGYPGVHGGASSVYVSGKYAYVTNSLDNGVEILDISDPSNPTYKGAIFDDTDTVLSGPTSIYVSGKYAYVASIKDNGVEILDISE